MMKLLTTDVLTDDEAVMADEGTTAALLVLGTEIEGVGFTVAGTVVVGVVFFWNADVVGPPNAPPVYFARNAKFGAPFLCS